MSHETLRVIRNILLRAFAVGIFIALIAELATISGWTLWVDLASEWFRTDSATLAKIVLGFFMQVKFFLLFVVLTPALAIHWTLRVDQNGKK